MSAKIIIAEFNLLMQLKQFIGHSQNSNYFSKKEREVFSLSFSERLTITIFAIMSEQRIKVDEK